MIEPLVIILSSRFDLTTDLVVHALRRMGITYLRLNSEDLAENRISLDPIAPCLHGEIAGTAFRVDSDTLQSVYFRRPVFLRHYGCDKQSVEERFQQDQWAALIRNLMVFDRACWMNHPGATYVAEHKAVQLAQARRIGLDVPSTIITNNPGSIRTVSQGASCVAAKGLDTVLIRHGQSESFGYTNIVSTDIIDQATIDTAPVVFQEALLEKLDLRVTVVGATVFTAAITKDSEPIHGDWRSAAPGTELVPYSLPNDVADRCRELVATLGLSFGAIDLAAQHGRYYFLEINPTGEWAWLAKRVHSGIPEAVAAWLGRTRSKVHAPSVASPR